jgi:hypothetical protein
MFVETLIVDQLIKKSPDFIEPYGALLFSHKPFIKLCPKSIGSSLYSHILFL